MQTISLGNEKSMFHHVWGLSTILRSVFVNTETNNKLIIQLIIATVNQLNTITKVTTTCIF